MRKFIVLLILLLTLSASATQSQEVVVTGFPLGTAGSVSDDFFAPYYQQLAALADTLSKYTLTHAIVTGGSDGDRYNKDSDAKNPALALGRAHALANLLVNKFKVDSMRIRIQTEDTGEKGAQYRFASVRISWDLSNLQARLDDVERRPPVVKHFTEIKEVPAVQPEPPEYVGLEFGAGLSSSPFGGIPIIHASMTWKGIVFVEGIMGHTFWNGDYPFEGEDLDTKRRMAGAQIVVYPKENLPIGIVGGWIHIEEISQDFYEYVRMSEGPMLGLRASPFDFMYITGVYNPSKHRVVGADRSTSDNDQFLLSATFHLGFGGGR
ncbi:MAG: hypothetical protein V3T31_08710 [candidate division Zixibacteria bacterium]